MTVYTANVLGGIIDCELPVGSDPVNVGPALVLYGGPDGVTLLVEAADTEAAYATIADAFGPDAFVDDLGECADQTQVLFCPSCAAPVTRLVSDVDGDVAYVCPNHGAVT